MKKILVLGNGFDLSLGLKTRYSDYFESECFKELDESNILKKAIRMAVKENWTDLEEIIKNTYIDNTSLYNKSYKNHFESNDFNEYDFNELSENLAKYLNNIDSTIDTNSAAAKLLQAVVESKEYKIFTFNYTNLNKSYKQIDSTKSDLPHDIPIAVHGILKNGIVLGCEQTEEVHNNFSFIFKAFGRHYQSNTLTKSLSDATEIIFFGHSFGTSDFNYFERFLTEQAKSDLTDKKRKCITIITYNYDALMNIFKNFRTMGINVEYLRNDNDFSIYFTETDSIDSLCNFIKKSSPFYEPDMPF